MLRPYTKEIDRFGFVYAHLGTKEEAGNRCYAVAAAVLAPDREVAHYDSLIRYSHFTRREQYRSNLSAGMLRQAPDAPKVGQQLDDFLQDIDILVTLVPPAEIEAVQRLCQRRRIVDLGFAAAFFLPQLPSAAPKRLAEYIEGRSREKISFSAPEMVSLSLKLFRHILDTILSDSFHPRATALRYYLDKSNTLFGRLFVDTARNYKRFFGGLFSPCSLPDVPAWQRFLPQADKIKRGNHRQSGHRTVSPELVHDLVKGLASAGRGYRFRPEQERFARSVAEALGNGEILCIEAGTGTGKTVGYLLPVLSFLDRNPDARVVISTYTKNLQEQIFLRELTLLKEIFEGYRTIPAAVLKGKSSYVCARKLEMLNDDAMGPERKLAWLFLVNLIYQFRDADVDGIGEHVRYYLDRKRELKVMLGETSSRSGCTPRHRSCPAQLVTAEAAKARLIITNHFKLALLDRDLLLSGLFRNLIIDEANHFEQGVRSAFSPEVVSRELTDGIRPVEGLLNKILARGDGEIGKQLRKAHSGILTLKSEVHNFNLVLNAVKPNGEPGEIAILPASHKVFQNRDPRFHLKSLRSALEQILCLEEPLSDPDSCRMLKLQSRAVNRIKVALNQLGEYADTLETIAANLTDESYIPGFQVFRNGWLVSLRHVDVGDLIREHIYTYKDSVVYTAATLRHNESFENFRKIVGLDSPLDLEPVLEDEAAGIAKGSSYNTVEVRTVQIPSPFAAENRIIQVPDDALSGRFDNKPAWLARVAEKLPRLIRKNRGRTLVLFASYKDLMLVADKISMSLESEYPLLVQRPGVSTLNLCDEFRAVKESVLLGVDTFWYGVDFKGDTLTQVVITRIPYPNPRDPVQAARREMLTPRDYWSRYHYDTHIKMQQGIGRLIRSESDRGRVVILDSRYKV
jgi:ATP-dependent DNA helicase DinG